MDAKKVRKIVNREELIPSKLSQELLLAIIDGRKIKQKDLPNFIRKKEIDTLRRQYEEIIQTLSLSDPYPRNLPFYYIAEMLVNDFTICGDLSDPTKITYNSPRIHNIRPSLLSILLGKVNSLEDTVLHRNYEQVYRLPNHIVQILDQAFQEINVIYPSEQIMKLFVSWVKTGLSGEELQIVSPCCPDYSYIMTGDPKVPYHYTFNTLNEGIGIVGRSLIKVLHILYDALTNCKIKAKFTIAIGDFEADSKENLKKLGLGYDEFIRKLRKSQTAIQESLMFPAEVVLFSELCSGKSNWDMIYNQIEINLNEGKLGNTDLSKEQLHSILSAREKLYQKWWGPKTNIEEYMPILFHQGAQYAAMGSIVSTFLKNAMILGADHEILSPFYQYDKPIPVIYIHKAYQ